MNLRLFAFSVVLIGTSVPMLGVMVTFLNYADQKYPIHFQAQSSSGTLSGTITYGSNGVKIDTTKYKTISFDWDSGFKQDPNITYAGHASSSIDLANYKHDTTVKMQKSGVMNRYDADGYSEWVDLVPDRTKS